MWEIAVLGPGGVGGFLAAALARAGAPVTVVAREDTAAQLGANGIDVESVRLGDFRVDVPAVARLDAEGATVIVATKANGLAAALDRVEGEPELVVPLLNGLDHLVPLRERYGERAVAASIRIESDRPEPGRVVQTSAFLRVDVAPPSDAVERFARTLRGAGVPVDVLDSEPQVIWGKLVRLCALACTTSAFDLPLGPIRDDPERAAALRACVEEAAAVARAEGAAGDVARTLRELADAHPTLSTSMRRDITAGRAPELDAIAGTVLRAAVRHGLECPTIERLAARVAERAQVPAP